MTDIQVDMTTENIGSAEDFITYYHEQMRQGRRITHAKLTPQQERAIEPRNPGKFSTLYGVTIIRGDK